ncbi:transmembrane protein, putative [Entamoeba invadens IP1]|uniref:Transmembrane protein, putative n=1 Tax=Entamoeba invadens IP1 TaxID=370355 RepID=A0A0A1UDR7_ENTIV|nr:transmembrane protein, putative [Entamoeba invadens IP1]ELP94739.1 transmembrane protein, putative [Entamoeba invadens IP1]|eukprot:XP_004261510.1 transmembrane protein, putative [Entamoeba invadens IP1]
MITEKPVVDYPEQTPSFDVQDTSPVSDSETSLLQQSSDEKKSETKHISTFSVFPLVVNAAIGTGVFGLPLAYFEAGVYPSLLILILFFFLNNITAGYVLEALSRLNVLPSKFSTKYIFPEVTPLNEKTPLEDQKQHLVDQKLKYEVVEQNCIIKNTYGYTEMGLRLGGSPLKIFSNMCIILNCYGGLWAYVATCVTTFVTVIWIIVGDQEKCSNSQYKNPWECQVTYYWSIFVYSVLVIPLSFLDVGRQAFIQIALTFIRFFSFGVMVITCVVQISMTGPLDAERNVFAFYWDGFGTMFTHTAFAFVVQHTLPALIGPVKGDKKKVHFAICSALSIASVFYLLVAIVCAYTFNGKVKTPVTLNWANYTGRDGGWGDGKELWFAYIIKYLILFFPVLNLTSTFPLLSNTLAANIEDLFPLKVKKRHGRWTKFGSRAIAIFPPFILTMFSSSLKIIFDVSGIIAFFLAFTLPCIYVFMSLYRFNNIKMCHLRPKTPYTNWVTSTPVAITAVFFVTLTLFCVSLYFLIQNIVLSF